MNCNFEKRTAKQKTNDIHSKNEILLKMKWNYCSSSTELKRFSGQCLKQGKFGWSKSGRLVSSSEGSSADKLRWRKGSRQAQMKKGGRNAQMKKCTWNPQTITVCCTRRSRNVTLGFKMKKLTKESIHTNRHFSFFQRKFRNTLDL